MPDNYSPNPMDNTQDAQDGYSGTVSPADISSSGKPRARAIKDSEQAKNIVNSLQFANRERNIKNARIMGKYNSERPYPDKALEAEGLGWKANFTTKPLPMLIDKVAPRFVQAVEGVKYLTNSALPDSVPGAADKTEAFRREITTTIRKRAGWKELLGEIAQENALFGYAAVAWLDEFHWFPKFFRQDAFFVPTGTKQIPKSAQIVALLETFLVHELFDLVSDLQAAKARGWNVEKTIDILNKAMPDNRRSRQLFFERIYEDLIRESNVGASYESGPRVVKVWHLLATETTGKVSHYIFDSMYYAELFSSEDQFENMAEATAFFAFQQGNGTLHGSKGIGREIYAMAGILDRSRNEVVDRLNLAGKIIVQGDEKALKRFKMSLVGNTVLIAQGYQVLDRKFEPGVAPFLELDTFLTNLLDQMAGATTPKFFEGERVTKAQVDLFASREEESRDIVLGRFLNQFASMVSTLQRRLCNPNTAENDAKEMQKRLLEVMSREELNQLSEQPVAETVRDYTEVKRQAVVLVAQEGRGNPLYNQRELEHRKVSAQIDDEFADAVLLPEEDPTVTAEQTRLQQLELLLIVGQGTQVPISPRDNDLVHLGVLMPVMEQVAQQAAADPHADETLHALLAHAEPHLESAKAKGADKQQIAKFEPVIQKLRANMAELAKLGEQQKALAGAPPSAAAPAPTAPPPQTP